MCIYGLGNRVNRSRQKHHLQELYEGTMDIHVNLVNLVIVAC